MVSTAPRPTPLTPTVAVTETRVILTGVSWETFERLLAETGSQRSQRFAYCDGKLEIMVPLAGHEEPTRLFDDFVGVMVDELGLELRKLGSLTLKQLRLERGLEPDCCFYIQHEAEVRGIDALDFESYPPPDLAVEVDNTHQSLDKFPIYAALGVPEVWRLRGNQLSIYHLNSERTNYDIQPHSLAFPDFPILEIPRFIQQAKKNGQRAAVRAFRVSVQAAIG